MWLPLSLCVLNIVSKRLKIAPDTLRGHRELLETHNHTFSTIVSLQGDRPMTETVNPQLIMKYESSHLTLGRYWSFFVFKTRRARIDRTAETHTSKHEETTLT